MNFELAVAEKGPMQLRKRNKRHHFIPVTYMNGFCGPTGKIYAYRAEDPTKPLHVDPRGIGYQNYYYSQPLPDGDRDDHQFEDFWNKIETVWRGTLLALRHKELNYEISFNTLGFATMMRTRVPAAREFHETLMATTLRLEVKALAAIDRLPRELLRYKDELDTVPIGVNPQRTIVSMTNDMRRFGDVCCKMGFEIIHNESDINFVSSDNPVCYFDPTVHNSNYAPYDVGNEVELYFPLDTKTLLRGSHKIRPFNIISRHRVTREKAFARKINYTIAKFSYRLLLSDSRVNDELAQEYSALSPIAEIEVSGPNTALIVKYRNAFGPRPKLCSFVDTPEKVARLERG